MARIGLLPGQDFDASKLGASDKKGLAAVPKLAQLKIMEYFKEAAVTINSWSYHGKPGGMSRRRLTHTRSTEAERSAPSESSSFAFMFIYVME